MKLQNMINKVIKAKQEVEALPPSGKASSKDKETQIKLVNLAEKVIAEYEILRTKKQQLTDELKQLKGKEG